MTIIELLMECERDTKRLQSYLAESDFFLAPASSRHHLAEIGGLAKHTMNVFAIMSFLNEWFINKATRETIILISICHDLCKVGMYVPSDEESSPAQQKYVRDLFYMRKLNPEYAKNKTFCSSLIEWAKGGFQGDEPVPQQQWEIKDDFPIGHGTKSALIASRLVALTDDELLAIKWHSGPWESSDMEKRAFQAATEKTPLVPMLFAADYLASHVTERKEMK